MAADDTLSRSVLAGELKQFVNKNRWLQPNLGHQSTEVSTGVKAVRQQKQVVTIQPRSPETEVDPMAHELTYYHNLGHQSTEVVTEVGIYPLENIEVPKNRLLLVPDPDPDPGEDSPKGRVFSSFPEGAFLASGQRPSDPDSDSNQGASGQPETLTGLFNSLVKAEK